MKTKVFYILSLAVVLVSCNNKTMEQKGHINRKHFSVEKRNVEKRDSTVTASDHVEENANDEFISASLFEKWKGRYVLKEEGLPDSYGRESVSYSELILVKPDSCIFKSWLPNAEGFRYTKDDNYQEYTGGILATPNTDSIEIYTKRVVAGGNNSLSPLLTLVKKNNTYMIYSMITSPPHHGMVGMPIVKQ